MHTKSCLDPELYICTHSFLRYQPVSRLACLPILVCSGQAADCELSPPLSLGQCHLLLHSTLPTRLLAASLMRVLCTSLVAWQLCLAPCLRLIHSQTYTLWPLPAGSP